MFRILILPFLFIVFCAFTYPEYVATKQDYLNLLQMPNCKKQALNELQRIYAAKDESATRVISGSEETKDMKTERIPNPNPLWKQKGFSSRDEVLKIIEQSK